MSLIISVVLMLCIVLGGCSESGIETGLLMRPPRATGERAEIQEVIDSVAKDRYTFKYPQSGNYRSAIIMQDITGDGQQEAVALYRTSDENSRIHLLIIDEVNGIWRAVGDFESTAPEVSRVEFVDLDDNGDKEIIVGYSTYSAMFNSLAVYSYDGKIAKSVEVSETFTNFIIGDFTGDGGQELMLISLFNNDSPASARLMHYSRENNRLGRQYEVAMDSDATRFASIGYERISENVCAAVADSQSVDSNYFTQIIYYDKATSQLLNSLYSAQNDNKSMHRQTAILSADIDSDGIIEIPVSKKMPYDPADEMEELVASEVVYSKYDPAANRFVETERFITAADLGYSYREPNFMKNITARVDISAKTLSIYSLAKDKETGEETNKKGELQLTIRAFTAEDWEQNGAQSGFVKALESGNIVIAFAVPQNGAYEIKPQKFADSILIG